MQKMRIQKQINGKENVKKKTMKKKEKERKRNYRSKVNHDHHITMTFFLYGFGTGPRVYHVVS